MASRNEEAGLCVLLLKSMHKLHAATKQGGEHNVKKIVADWSVVTICGGVVG